MAYRILSSMAEKPKDPFSLNCSEPGKFQSTQRTTPSRVIPRAERPVGISWEKVSLCRVWINIENLKFTMLIGADIIDRLQLEIATSGFALLAMTYVLFTLEVECRARLNSG